MAEKIITQEVTIQTKKHEFYCDDCGMLIHSYNDSDILGGIDSAFNCKEPDRFIYNINLGSSKYQMNKLLCNDCRIKRTKDICGELKPVLLKLGFYMDS